jgi:sulfate transport system substrate-binding protein
VRTTLIFASFWFALFSIGCGERRADADPAPSRATATASSTSDAAGASAKPRAVELEFVAFSLAREAYETRLLSEFALRCRKTMQTEVRFHPSYGGSGSQARAVADGLEADVVALSLDQDVDLLVHAGRVSADWRTLPHGAIVSRSIVVLAVRKGNPLAIRDWTDLARPGLHIVNADPRTSGAGRWNLSAVFGAALRGRAGVPGGDRAEAERLVERVLANVTVQGKDAESAFRAFAAGAGDVALASESQVNRGRMFGNDYEAVIPASTLRIDNPVAIVDSNAEKHGVRAVAEAFVEFLAAADAQRAFAFYGFRPVDPSVAASYAAQFPVPPDLFTIDDIGGWPRVSSDLFAPDGFVERASRANASHDASPNR